jgi:hypothetical protein
MAKIRTLSHDTSSGRGLHPTEVDARWQVLQDTNGLTLFQLSTYGSDSRESEPKVSQTLQIDKVGATELVRLLHQTFDI